MNAMRFFRCAVLLMVGAALPSVAPAAEAVASPPAPIVSDTNTQFSVDGKHWSPAVVAWVHFLWPKLDDASWVWTAYKVTPEEAEHGSPVITFRRVFKVAPRDAGPAKLTIAVDNAYTVSLNGKLVGGHGAMVAHTEDDGHFRVLDGYDVMLAPGVNTLSIKAINYFRESSSPEGNPGGIVFKIAFAPPIAQAIAESGKAQVYGIHFDTGKAIVKPDSKPVLDEIGKLMSAQPALKLEIAGHTDNQGAPAVNLALSKKRAEAVVATLVSRYKIDAGRLQAAGYGDTKPVADNGGAEGRARNRRVEITRLP